RQTGRNARRVIGHGVGHRARAYGLSWRLSWLIPLKETVMAKKTGFKPGETAPNSGQYQEVGPRGEKGREVTTTKGEPLPPTTTPGSSYTLVDRTKNKSGRG